MHEQKMHCFIFASAVNLLQRKNNKFYIKKRKEESNKSGKK